MAEDHPGTTLIVSDSVTYDLVKGLAPGTAAVLAARREVMPNLDRGRILVDRQWTKRAAPRGCLWRLRRQEHDPGRQGRRAAAQSADLLYRRPVAARGPDHQGARRRRAAGDADGAGREGRGAEALARRGPGKWAATRRRRRGGAEPGQGPGLRPCRSRWPQLGRADIRSLSDCAADGSIDPGGRADTGNRRIRLQTGGRHCSHRCHPNHLVRYLAGAGTWAIRGKIHAEQSGPKMDRDADSSSSAMNRPSVRSRTQI
jgi:hypothetical protein